MDPAHEQTEQIIKRMEKALMREYQDAAREIKKKADKYLSDFKVKDATWQKMLADGEVTARDYKNWRTGQIMTGKRWSALQEQIAENMVHANQIAHSIAYGYQPEAYALNLNFATYEVEHSGKLDTNYTLYDKQTVERIMREDPDMLPPPREGSKTAQMIAENKDLRWNRQRVSSVMMQGIMQGEPIEKLATRLAENVATNNYKSAVRYARTMTTNTQNAGRYEGYRRATKMGVDLTIEWCATLDNRTRHNHRMLHGQRRNVDEPFEVDGIKILYPAELNGKDYKVPESMIWNCRCTLLAWVKGFEGDTVKSSPKMGDMSFEEWQNDKAPKKTSNDDVNSKIGSLSNNRNVDLSIHKDEKNRFDLLPDSVTEKSKQIGQIHNAKHRAILKDRLVNGLTFEELAEKHNLSVRHVKTIVYKAEDKLFSHFP